MLLGARIGCWSGGKVDYGGKSVLEVTIPEGGGAFGFHTVTAPAGTLIEWGDGTSTEYTEKTHHYAEGGKYRVKIGKEATYFRVSTTQAEANLVSRFFTWGENINSAASSFYNCRQIGGTIPPWTAKITTASSCYYACFGFEGSVPEWVEGISNAAYCYTYCRNLTGEPPPWNAKIISGVSCYDGCTKLSGRIPEWGDAMTNAGRCYHNCAGLTSLWSDNLTDEEIMPSRISNTANCVSGTSAELRAHFYTAWGGTKPVPTA